MSDDEELLRRLRAADPARRTDPGHPNWINDLTEATMSTPSRPTSSGSRATWLVAAAAVALVALGLGFLTLRGGTNPTANPTSSAPASTTGEGSPSGTPSSGPSGSSGEAKAVELTLPGGTTGRCLPPSQESLKRLATTAFVGMVTSVDGRVATLEVGRWYRVPPNVRLSRTVQLTSASDDFSALLGGVQFEDGGRYLIAANSDGETIVCGHSGPWSKQLAALYAGAFG